MSNLFLVLGLPPLLFSTLLLVMLATGRVIQGKGILLNVTIVSAIIGGIFTLISVLLRKRRNASSSHSNQNTTLPNNLERDLQGYPGGNTQDYQAPTMQDSKTFDDPNSSNNDFSDEYINYVTAIFLDAYKKGSSLLDDDKYWGYIRYGCGLSHPRRFHEELIENGYFERPSLYDYLSSYTVADLKIILDSIGQKKTGKKAELIDRIIKNLSEEEKSRICNNANVFTLSEKGKLFLKEHADYVLLRKYPDGSITFDDYITAKKEIPFKANFYDVLWSIYNKRQRNCLFNKEFDPLSNIYSSMAKILIDEKKFVDATYYCVRSLYLELSGIEQYASVKMYCENNVLYSIEDLTDAYYPFLPLYSINLFKMVKEYYNPSILKRVIATTRIPFSITSENEFSEFIQTIINDNIMSEEEYRDMMTYRYQKYVKSIQH